MTDEWTRTSRRKSTSGDASMRRSIQGLAFSMDPNIKIEPEVEDVRQFFSFDLVTQICTSLIHPISLCFQRKYAFDAFAIRQPEVALLLNKTADEAKYANRLLVRTILFLQP